MRRFSLAFLALVLGISLTTIAQGTAGGDYGRGVPKVQVKGVNLSGQVSKDGKMFLADDDNTWSVNNLDILKGFEGRYVTVKCRMDPSKRAIHVLDVLERHLTNYTNFKDSAFRR
jgi:hypothetical protein